MMTICTELRNINKSVLCTWGPVGKKTKENEIKKLIQYIQIYIFSLEK